MADKRTAIAAAAQAALEKVEDGCVLAVGSGCAAELFAELLAGCPRRPDAVLSWSPATTALLERAGFVNADPNRAGAVDLCVDGADECTERRTLLCGTDGNVAHRKAAAAAAREFIAIVEATALSGVLGGRPVAVEVLPFARSLAARGLVGLGADPVLREDCGTQGGNRILDCSGLDLTDAAGTERAVKMLPGVVECGICAVRPADVVLLACEEGLRRLVRQR